MAATDTSKRARAAKSKRASASRGASAKPRTSERATATPAAGTATSSSTRPSTPVARARRLAERVVLIQVGAALEARDRVAGTFEELVGPYRSRRALEARLEQLEQRGGSVRSDVEREVRKRRTQLEREARNAQRRLDLPLRPGGIQERIENVVQNGLDAGRKLVNGAQGRIARAI